MMWQLGLTVVLSGGSDREEVGALGREAVAAGGAGQAAAQPRGGVLAGPAGVLAAGGEPLGPARLGSGDEGGGGWGRRGRPAAGGRDGQDLAGAQGYLAVTLGGEVQAVRAPGAGVLERPHGPQVDQVGSHLDGPGDLLGGDLGEEL